MKHSFEPYVPQNAKYLLLGSFPGKEQTTGTTKENDWYYGNSRNQFWPFLEEVYKIPLQTKMAKQLLFESLKLAITDVFSAAERKKDSSLDVDLINTKPNDEVIGKILAENRIEKIFCTSRYVERIFNSRFPNHQATYLPFPSRRNAKMSREEKIAEYIRLLPRYETK
jgi:hypoxanthine-DNA glycosylase